MKIVNRKQFLQMPVGTVFSKYVPSVFHDLMIKDSEAGRYENDFLYSGLIGAIDCNSSGDFIDKCDAMERGESVGVDFDSTSRDGLFEDEQLFAIYEKEDVQKLIQRLSEAATPSNLE